jgi:hypothetical protein
MTYSPARDLVFRTSYTLQSQFPEANRTETLFPEDIGASPTAQDPAAQLIRLQRQYLQRNQLKTEHAENIDLGVEKAFDALQGSWNLSLTGFRRTQYDLVQYTRRTFDVYAPPTPALIGYNNDGTGHTSGIELKLSKIRRRPSDWNGFVTYTNQVARATSSLYDTSQIPYFFAFNGGDPFLTDADYRRLNKREFATSYDQRHTVYVVATKRLSKRIETSFVLDSGSGFPFAGGAPSDGPFGSADSQHGEKVVGDADFSEVPVTLLNGRTIQPINPVVGRTGWHHKVSINTNLTITPTASFFLNIDNLFNEKIATVLGTQSQSGQIYYQNPTAEYPQGRISYGSATIVTPIFTSFGFRYKF